MTLWNKAQQAAFRLDKLDPEWYKKIDLEKLDMNACGYCIIAQLFEEKGYEGQVALAHDLMIDEQALGWQEVGSVRDDLTSFEEDSMYTKLNKKLTEYWKTLIKLRRDERS